MECRSNSSVYVGIERLTTSVSVGFIYENERRSGLKING